jgi:uncharacterized membrane protein
VFNPFDTFFGVPIHPLLIHFAVVLVVLAAGLAILVVLLPGQRRRFAGPMVLLSAAAALAALATAQSGRVLSDRLGLGSPGTDGEAPIATHQTWGTVTSYLAVGLAVAALLWFWRGRTRSGQRSATGGSPVWAVLLVVTALASVAGVVVTGHIGAELVWGDIVEATEAP